MNKTNDALNAEKKFRTSVEEAQEYIENFDILETINNVGNDEVFTPVKVCKQMLDMLPEEVWLNPNYKWLNPCDKNGVFLREIALRLDSGLSEWESDNEKRRKHILQNMIYSIGLTKFTAQVSRRTVYYCSQANRKFDEKVDQDGNSINGYAIGNGEWFQSDQGNVLTPKTEHTFKKGKCIYCGTAEKNKDGKPGRYSDPKQLEHYAYEFIHVENVEKHLQNRFFGGKNMKFDIIIGNPPYQLSDGGQGASAKPLYNLFVDQAIKLNPKYFSMIIPSRWMAGGKGLDSFREKMIQDTHIRELHDFIDHKICFPNANITGGVCYFLWDSNYSKKCSIYRYDENGVTESLRYLKEKGVDIVIRDEGQANILKKVQALKEENFSKVVSPRKPYGLSGDFMKNPSKYGLPPISEKPFSNCISIWGIEKGNRIQKYLTNDYPIPNRRDDLDKYKIFINRGDGAAGYIGNPKPARILGTPILGKPREICSETFLSIGPFDSEVISDNTISYMKTKFFRFLVGIRKISQDMSSRVYEFVPMQDFSKSWSDKELYTKYDLSDDEINYIESHVQEVMW